MRHPVLPGEGRPKKNKSNKIKFLAKAAAVADDSLTPEKYSKNAIIIRTGEEEKASFSMKNRYDHRENKLTCDIQCTSRK